jgi:hypothetical protein
MKPIPISTAKQIAKAYGYDQVVIIARDIGEDGGEHVTTYGTDKANCEVAARIGDFIKHKIMGWPRVNGDSNGSTEYK